MLNVNIRLYNFPTSSVGGMKKIGFEDDEIDGRTLMAKVSETLEINADTIGLFFRGKEIKSDDNLLTSCGFKSGCSVQVLYKPPNEDQSPEISINPEKLRTYMHSFHVVMSNRHYKWKTRKMLAKILTDPEKFQPVLDAVSGLKHDTVALGILKNPSLFALIVDPKNVDRIMELNTNLAAAIIHLWWLVSKQMEKSSNEASTSSPQAMWPPSDAMMEDMDVDSSGANTSHHQQQRRGLITSNQLARALSAATSPLPGQIISPPMGSSTSSSMQSPQTGTGSSGGAMDEGSPITPDVFSMAMQQALAQ
ncbi:unnamed protein product [Clavelina lepadiformis]|uniref:Ubiquitin-like domain-containing protein n=1 Tax=Clavelina lepadiformis TaxID=159417 RepID=A0ABP0GQL5_CLALP